MNVCTSRSFSKKKIYTTHFSFKCSKNQLQREREIKQKTKVSYKNSNHMFYKITMKAFMKYERVLFSLFYMKKYQKYIEIRYVFYILFTEW